MKKAFKLCFLFIPLLVACGGKGGGLFATSKKDEVSYPKAIDYQGLPLIAQGVHMKKGDHNYVITEQFYENLTDHTSNGHQGMTINALKEAFLNLNNALSYLNINLVTTADDLAEKYNVSKIESIGEQDISLYLVDEYLDNNRSIVAKATVNYDETSKETNNLTILFNKDATRSVWKSYSNYSESINPYNTLTYTFALRTSMETLGFGYFNDKESVMNTPDADSPHNLTDYDLSLLAKYEQVFYGSDQ